MQSKRRIKLKIEQRDKHRPINAYRLISETTRLKNPIGESYNVDMEELKESLRKIEQTYYSSSIRMDRIKKKKMSQFIRMKLPEIFKSNKRLFKQSGTISGRFSD